MSNHQCCNVDQRSGDSLRSRASLGNVIGSMSAYVSREKERRVIQKGLVHNM